MWVVLLIDEVNVDHMSHYLGHTSLGSGQSESRVSHPYSLSHVIGATGDFFHLVKKNFDPIQQRYAEQSRSIMMQQHVPLKPRGYQEEMAAKALRGNSLLVAPTGCGKTKVIAMVLDDMWRRNPAAKVRPSFLSVPFFCLVATTPTTSKVWAGDFGRR